MELKIDLKTAITIGSMIVAVTTTTVWTQSGVQANAREDADLLVEINELKSDVKALEVSDREQIEIRVNMEGIRREQEAQRRLLESIEGELKRGDGK